MDVFDAFTKNDLLISMLSTIVGENVDLDPAEEAFKATKGDFHAKFTAAVEARLAQLAVPEVFIELPEHPESLRKAELDALVRPAAAGFLSEYVNKTELLAQVSRIRWRQEERPAWIPRIDRSGNPLDPPGTGSAETDREPDRPLVVTALAEVGEITVLLPDAGQERPELTMAPGGVGEWESALYALLGIVGDDAPARTVTIDAAANQALVPETERWWSTEPPHSVPAAQDPGVASELLATSATLGGLPVADNTAEAYDAVIDALGSVGDWRYSPQWRLEAWHTGDDTATLAVSRAAITAWASEQHSGLIMYVYGGALHTTEGLYGTPGPLHSYVLVVTRAADGSDTVDAAHRIILSCPGQQWCHRGGCPDIDFPEVAALLTTVVTAGHATQAATDGESEDWAETHQRLYGDGDGPEYTDYVLELLAVTLSRAGWIELERSTWEGGLEQVLMRRGEHCLTAAYDPITRQVQLSGGKNELELTLQLLSDEGILIGDDDTSLTVTINDTTSDGWGTDLLTAADDALHDRIRDIPQLVTLVQLTLLGLHPHADGTLRSPLATRLAEQQLNALFKTVEKLTEYERSS